MDDATLFPIETARLVICSFSRNEGAMFDNTASQNVLNKLGFVKTGEDLHKTSGRVEEAPLFLYRLRNAKIGTS